MSEMPDDQVLRDKAQVLLDAAYDYWREANKHGMSGAIQWLDDVSGRTVIFTRGEYRETLLRNVDQMRFEGARLATLNLDTSNVNGIAGADDKSLMEETTLPYFRK